MGHLVGRLARKRKGRLLDAAGVFAGVPLATVGGISAL